MNLNRNLDENAPATKVSMIDYYANRMSHEFLKDHLHKIKNLIDFVTYFVIKNNKLALRPLPEKTVVIFYPKIRYYPDNPHQHKQYCYHQMIKYSPWCINTIDQIRSVDTAVQRWTHFLKSASNEILSSIK